jgi:hypothetical protein
VADQANEDRWTNPTAWSEWSALLLVEMERHDWPFGRPADPEDYRDFFEDGVDPHSAIEEAFNDGI